MKNLSAHLALLGSNLIWACGYPLYNFVMPTYIKPLSIFTAELIFTGIIAFISPLWSGKQERVERSDIFSFILAALLIVVLRKGMLIFGLSMTSPIDGSIISTITPIVVLVISVLLGVENFSRRRALGIALAFGGAIGVILSGGNGLHHDTGMYGNLLILLCAFISAIYMVWFKRLLRRYEPMTILRWMFMIGAIIVAPIGLKSLINTPTIHFTHKAWFAITYLVVMPTYIPNLLLTSALKRVPPTVTSIYTYVQPAAAVALSVAFGLDTLRMITLLFGTMLFTGLGIVITTSKRG